MSVMACDILDIANGKGRCVGGVQRSSFDEVLRNADMLSLHVPLTDSTHHLIGARELEAMKPSAILVNTSRGAVIDQAALVQALSSGKLLGAALDVLEKEPPEPADPLLRLDNVILSPHAAALTRQSYRSVALFVANEVVKALSEPSTSSQRSKQ
jgi:phosphoglycerate dehydrogenase-like enzyme